jgi:hypothetical protein
MKLFTYLLVFLLSFNSYATNCKESVVLLEEGKPAPCTGFLFSPSAEKQASKAVDDAKYYKELSDLLHNKNELLISELKVQDERLMLYMKSTHELAQEVNRKQNEDFWQKTLYFSLGIVTTSLAVYGAAQLSK